MAALDPGFWRGQRVLLTGHTGFKGSWAALWLAQMGAEVTGLALAPDQTPSLFELAAVETRTTPFEISLPITVQCSMEVHAPSGFKAQPISEGVPDIKNQFVSGNFTATTNADGWRMNYRFGEFSGRFAPEEYPAHNLAMRQTLDMLDPRLVCVRNSK